MRNRGLIACIVFCLVLILASGDSAFAASKKTFRTKKKWKKNTLVTVTSSTPACVAVNTPQPIAVGNRDGTITYEVECVDQTCSSLITVSGTGTDGNPQSYSWTVKCVKRTGFMTYHAGMACEDSACTVEMLEDLACEFLDDTTWCAVLPPGECFECSPTMVELSSLRASAHNGVIEVNWTTANEVVNAGFNVHRSQSNAGPNNRLNAELIPARGDMLQQVAYSFVDENVTDGVTYYYWVEDVDVFGVSSLHGPASARVRDLESRPVMLRLAQNSPNPFNGVTEIRYGLPADCYVNLTIYDPMGREVRTLVAEHQDAGYRVVHWDGKDGRGSETAGGVYFCRLQANNQVDMKKMVYMK